MAELGGEVKVEGVFGGVEFNNASAENIENVGTIRNNNLPVKVGFWNSFKSFWLQEIDWKKEIRVELTPYQQKVEDEINEFLHQEITWEKVHDFLFQEISFGKKKFKNM
ncbi:MAG: hypothetical protein HUJ68_13450 [Clostridia bacterium]|nr:hypothetical protein [Clostridia bacterium]